MCSLIHDLSPYPIIQTPLLSLFIHLWSLEVRMSYINESLMLIRCTCQNLYYVMGVQMQRNLAYLTTADSKFFADRKKAP